jgi:colanic acid biosynthesis protein WcaH
VRIPQGLYRKILGSMPLLCVDGIIRNSSGQVVLVKRNNEPLRNVWWVPGGRVLKGETLERAFRRKMREELGIKVGGLRCLGYSEAVNMRHRGIRAYGGRLHSISIVFESRLEGTEVTLDSQSSEWGYFDRLPARFRIQSFALK